ncbi:uncharacterized protein [Parasteatoda tepidariorum]|uniref:uncharacterized protein isoform X2 n=1 Tax=Parasteatoda tepidariorum TaxID=114398 RepID=UPI00077F9B5E|nr:uncharacterized protein LOC107438406 isoform X2 [Parasteatoda tepidariorum]
MVSIESKTRGFDIFWRIENVHSKIDLSLSSPSFKLKRMEGKWQLEIKQKNEFLAAYLYKEASHMNTRVIISVSLLADSGWIDIMKNTEVTYEAFRTGWGVHELISLENLAKQESFYLPNNSLTISFHVWSARFPSENSQWLITSQMDNKGKLCHQPTEAFSCLTHEVMLYFLPSFKFQSDKTLKSLKSKECSKPRFSEMDECSEEDVLKLLRRKKLGFVTIRTENKEFFVLKAVLSTDSPVLKNMLEIPNNGDCNLIDISDIDGDTMALVLKFLHYKTLEDINWNTLAKLFYVADKYQIGRLRRFCVSLLKKEISVENICDAISLADTHKNLQLMTYIQTFFCKNSTSILQSEKWKNFSLAYSELATNVLEWFAEGMP